FGAGAAMWMLLKKILDSRFRGNDNKDSGNDKNLLALWGGLLYMGTGAFAARVAAGHIEKILSFAWYPLFLLFLLRLFNCDFERLLRPAKGRGLAMTSSAAIGAIMGIVFLTGDVYGLLFMGIWYGVIGIIRGIRGIRVIGEIGVTIAAFIAVAGVKLVPFVLQVVPVMSRYSEFDAARGSIHAIYTWIPFVMPWGVVFYDRTVFQRFFNFWYNWYEYYAFIGLPLLYLVGLPRIIKRREVQLLLMLLVVGCMYIARGYPYSLFYWVEKSVPFLTWFRVPQRMYEALTSVVVVLIVLSAERLIRPPLAKSQGVALRTLVLFWGILLVTFLVSGYQMMQGFEKPRLEEEAVVRELRRRDGGDISVVTFACCMQTFLVRERIRVINYYYGWIPKGAPRFIRADGSAFSLEAIQTSRPTYIIAPKAMNFGEFGYTIWFGEGEIVVWRASTLTNYIRPGLPKG
ncbi:hypothetical protein HY032_01310, partial [Candidatus Gottesmanbacteria bacterium]|nr:hypothetical protein [Candidatus Gottesmanbacteria bacterium]